MEEKQHESNIFDSLFSELFDDFPPMLLLSDWAAKKLDYIASDKSIIDYTSNNYEISLSFNGEVESSVLCDDIILNIFSFLSCKEICIVKTVNKRFNDMSKDVSLVFSIDPYKRSKQIINARYIEEILYMLHRASNGLCLLNQSLFSFCYKMEELNLLLKSADGFKKILLNKNLVINVFNNSELMDFLLRNLNLEYIEVYCELLTRNKNNIYNNKNNISEKIINYCKMFEPLPKIENFTDDFFCFYRPYFNGIHLLQCIDRDKFYLYFSNEILKIRIKYNEIKNFLFMYNNEMLLKLKSKESLCFFTDALKNNFETLIAENNFDYSAPSFLNYFKEVNNYFYSDKKLTDSFNCILDLLIYTLHTCENKNAKMWVEYGFNLGLPHSLMSMALIHDEAKEYDKAFNAYKLCIERNENHLRDLSLNNLVILGHTYGELGEVAKAKRCYLIAVKFQYYEAEFHLGIAASQCLESNADSKYYTHKECIKWYSQAARKGHKSALHNLYANGHNYYNSNMTDIAESYLMPAADLGHEDAQWDLGNIFYDSGCYLEAATWYIKSIHISPNPKVIDNLVKTGIKLEKEDPISAITFYKIAAKLSNVEGAFSLGSFHYNKKDIEKAVKWWSIAAIQGKTTAINNIFLIGLQASQNDNSDLAHRCYLVSAKARMPEAQINLGLLLINENFEEGIDWIEEAAKQGHQNALNNFDCLGWEFSDNEEYEKSLKLWTLALGYCSQRVLNNTLELSRRLMKKNEFDLAELFLNIFEDREEPLILVNLGNVCFYRKEYIAAANWYIKSLENLVSSETLKNLLLTGRKLAESSDPINALQCYNTCAAYEYADSYFELGIFYHEHGHKEKALKWWRLSEKSGHRDAGINIYLLENGII